MSGLGRTEVSVGMAGAGASDDVRPGGYAIIDKHQYWLESHTQEGIQRLFELPKDAIPLDVLSYTPDGSGKTSTFFNLCFHVCGIEVLSTNPRLLEVVDAELMNAGAVSAFYRLCRFSNGIKLLADHPRLLSVVDEKNLGRYYKSTTTSTHQTPLKSLCKRPEGLHLLVNEQFTFDNIKAGDLFAVAVGGDKPGSPPIYGMTSFVKGINLLDSKPALRARLTREVLIRVYTSSFQSRCALWCLVRTERGVSFLSKHSHLLDSVIAADLQLKFTSRDGLKSILWYLSCSAVGRLLLLDKPHLLEGITFKILDEIKDNLVFDDSGAALFDQIIQAQALTGGAITIVDRLATPADECDSGSIIEGEEVKDDERDEGVDDAAVDFDLDDDVVGGDCDSISDFEVFWRSCRSEEGIKRLLQSPKEITTPELLTYSPTEEPGVTAFWCLCNCSLGIAYLAENSHLLSSVTPQMLNSIPESSLANTSALQLLTNALHGRKLLADNPDLLRVASIEGLSLPRRCSTKGTPLMSLFWSRDGHQILLDNDYLLDGISEEMLQMVPEGGPVKHVPVLDILTKEKSGIRLMSENRYLNRVITGALLTVKYTKYKVETMPLWHLARREAGIEFIANNPQIDIDWSPELLSLSPSSKDSEGQHIFWSLSCGSAGREFLVDNIHIFKHVTKEMLTSIPEGQKYSAYDFIEYSAAKVDDALMQKANELVFPGLASVAIIAPPESSPSSAAEAKAETEEQAGNMPNRPIVKPGEVPRWRVNAWVAELTIAVDMTEGGFDGEMYNSRAQSALCKSWPTGESLLWVLMNDDRDRKWIYEKRAILSNVITAEMLCNHGSASPGVSVLWHFANTDEGVKFLYEYPHLLKDLSIEALTQAPIEGENQGKSPLACLLSSETGCKVVDLLKEKHPSKEVVNTVILSLEAAADSTSTPFHDVSNSKEIDALPEPSRAEPSLK